MIVGPPTVRMRRSFFVRLSNVVHYSRCGHQEDLGFFFRGAWARALPAAFRPRGLVAFCARAFPAELAAFVPVRAGRPVCESALAAAVFAAVLAFGFLRTRDAAVAAGLRVCFVSRLDAIFLQKPALDSLFV